MISENSYNEITRCGHCGKFIPHTFADDKLKIHTVYWNKTVPEYYCDAQCSLNKYQSTMVNNNGISI